MESQTGETIPKDEAAQPGVEIQNYTDENGVDVEAFVPTDTAEEVPKPEEEKKKPGGLLGWYRNKVLGTAKDTLDRWKGKKAEDTVPKGEEQPETPVTSEDAVPKDEQKSETPVTVEEAESKGKDQVMSESQRRELENSPVVQWEIERMRNGGGFNPNANRRTNNNDIFGGLFGGGDLFGGIFDRDGGGCFGTGDPMGGIFGGSRRSPGNIFSGSRRLPGGIFGGGFDDDLFGGGSNPIMGLLGGLFGGGGNIIGDLLGGLFGKKKKR